ncbi:MAG: hypothetical protein V7L29_19435 [Nostoc sp.]|uniref:hypothetical protein n=1 Tax=Nostoc sp. TaxID=1180 RepID=UPI002FEE7122
MSFLKRSFNPTACLICLGFFTFTALPALADNCSKEDRVPLPGCVNAKIIRGGANIINNCNHPVTIKVDIADKTDKRVTIGAHKRTLVPVSGRYKLSCCPRYNKCSG